MLLGGGIAYAAPALWSYPDDHILISEVNTTGAPGTGTGTEWVELYNPTNNDIAVGLMVLRDSESEGFYAMAATPISTATPYPPINSHCFIYFAYDASVFYNEFNQCPDYAHSLDIANCPDTFEMVLWRGQDIDASNTSLCLYLDHYDPLAADTVGWGSGGTGSFPCVAVNNPIPGGAIAGETYLRGSDAPEWIGPGAEGEEIPGTPSTEQLGEVWNLSSNVDVPWEGPEVGACRQPTAIGLQNPRVSAAQDGGYALLLFGMFGLFITATVIVWRKGQIPPIERSNYEQ